MGYIIKSPTGGGGGGDATAANQTTQINQLFDGNLESVFLDPASSDSVFKNINNSVFKDATTVGVFKNINNESVFKDNAAESVFLTPSGDSNFYLNGSIAQHTFDTSQSLVSIGTQIGDTNNYLENSLTNNGSPFGVNTNSNVITFTDTTLAGVGAQLQTFLRGVGLKTIVNISFSSGGVAQHDIICVYKNF
jgi:hypothetical protein